MAACCSPSQGRAECLSCLSDYVLNEVHLALLQVPAYVHAGARQFCFMLRALEKVEPKLKALNIPFFMLQGDPTETVPKLVADSKASLLVTDYAPLRLGREWRDKVSFV